MRAAKKPSCSCQIQVRSLIKQTRTSWFSWIEGNIDILLKRGQVSITPPPITKTVSQLTKEILSLFNFYFYFLVVIRAIQELAYQMIGQPENAIETGKMTPYIPNDK